jgi:hypothetical protein
MLFGGLVIADTESAGGKIVVVLVGFEIGLGLLLGVGVGVAGFFPLLHTSFFPDFMQVNIIPLNFDVAPALEHEVPGVTFATAEGALVSKTNKRMSRIANRRFTD